MTKALRQRTHSFKLFVDLNHSSEYTVGKVAEKQISLRTWKWETLSHPVHLIWQTHNLIVFFLIVSDFDILTLTLIQKIWNTFLYFVMIKPLKKKTKQCQTLTFPHTLCLWKTFNYLTWLTFHYDNSNKQTNIFLQSEGAYDKLCSFSEMTSRKYSSTIFVVFLSGLKMCWQPALWNVTY